MSTKIACDILLLPFLRSEILGARRWWVQALHCVVWRTVRFWVQRSLITGAVFVYGSNGICKQFFFVAIERSFIRQQFFTRPPVLVYGGSTIIKYYGIKDIIYSGSVKTSKTHCSTFQATFQAKVSPQCS